LEVLEKRRATLGNSHTDTLNSINNLAVLFDNQERYDEAEPLYLEVLEKRRATLVGNSHPDTLNIINNLAVLYDDNQQGRYDEAEPLYLEVLEKRRATLGNSHPDTLNSINKNATTFVQLYISIFTYLFLSIIVVLLASQKF